MHAINVPLTQIIKLNRCLRIFKPCHTILSLLSYRWKAYHTIYNLHAKYLHDPDFPFLKALTIH